MPSIPPPTCLPASGPFCRPSPFRPCPSRPSGRPCRHPSRLRVRPRRGCGPSRPPPRKMRRASGPRLRTRSPAASSSSSAAFPPGRTTFRRRSIWIPLPSSTARASRQSGPPRRTLHRRTHARPRRSPLRTPARASRARRRLPSSPPSRSTEVRPRRGASSRRGARPSRDGPRRGGTRRAGDPPREGDPRGPPSSRQHSRPSAAGSWLRPPFPFPRGPARLGGSRPWHGTGGCWGRGSRTGRLPSGRTCRRRGRDPPGSV
mmetsp:Transcript_12127/g.29406  ORF Transcript_12127/g.29406 Transcript_12127/m.29406 type:complete len:260 (+) Transcript_12127:1536-2315(+)